MTHPRPVLRAACFTVCAATLTAAFAGRSTHAQAEQTSALSTRSGVYTEAQAARGEQTYANNCMGCHTTATYTQPSFRNSWNGASLWDLFAYISDAMPEDAPGSLSGAQYAEIVAYMLKLNRLPTGKAELTAEADALRKIRIELGSRTPIEAGGR